MKYSNSSRFLRIIPSSFPRRSLTTSTSTSTITTTTTPLNQKSTGTIASVFASLSNERESTLPHRFAELKRKLVPNAGAEEKLLQSWKNLLKELNEVNGVLAAKGNNAIPQVDYEPFVSDFSNSSSLVGSIHRCGAVLVKGVVTPEEALGWKESIRDYVRKNPGAKGFPEENPQVYELYWSKSQLVARSHPRVLSLLRRLNLLFHSSPSTPISLTTPLTYADRLRIRHPGDAKFALGPHIDGGSLERWEDPSYAGTYAKILEGRWEEWDAWELEGRIFANSDLYESAGGSSVFRAFQGWLSMSNTGPGEGTLRIYPSILHSTSYVLLRPFFRPIHPSPHFKSTTAYFHPDNWTLDLDSPSFPGSAMGRGQEFGKVIDGVIGSEGETHPHLELGRTMCSVPEVGPGDCVFWHCDMIHAVESQHRGKSDSSVLYIPAVPLTSLNATYLLRQRDAFFAHIPAPDFPGGEGEKGFMDRGGVDDIGRGIGSGMEERKEALRAMGLEKWDEDDGTEGERAVKKHANELLGF